MRFFDITRGFPQRIEGQYRRHWVFTPALWNLYFRGLVNLGFSMTVKSHTKNIDKEEWQQEDAAMAVAALVKKLQNGVYIDQNKKRRKFKGYFSKLLFAEHRSNLQKKLLLDFRFRCKAIH